MNEPRVQRRLAAILAADVVGYSRLMSEDEEGTHTALGAHRTEIIEPCISEHRGRVVKNTGDGLIAEFASVVDAVNCAIRFQEGMAGRNGNVPKDRRIEFRIGVNLGDVIVEEDDIYGDGVNVAARLEGLCGPGEVFISSVVHDQVESKLAATFDDLGEQTLKNIFKPVRVYRVSAGSGEAAMASDQLAGAPSLSDKPSIAVLPFENMSGDPEQEYFSDGITEDLITALSRIRWLLVIARNTTFTYKGAAVDAKQVAGDLNVRYIVEGSVRKSRDRVRITAQLVDGPAGNHVWAQRYDRKLEDVFDLQDELTEILVGAIEPALAKAEQQQARAKPPASLSAWDCYQRGMWHHYRRTNEDSFEARRLFERATELDSNFAPAYAGIAETYIHDVIFGFSERDHERALFAARRAVELDGEDPCTHLALGAVHYASREHQAAIAELETAIELNPSYAWAYYLLASSLAHSGHAEDAIPHTMTAIRLSPRDTNIGPFFGRLAMANLYLGRHEQAVDCARRALRHPTMPWPVRACLVSALSHLGRDQETRKALEDLRRHSPDFTVSFVSDHLPTTDTTYLDHLIDGLRKAGLPE